MQQARDDLAAHALTKRQLTDWPIDQRAQLEERDQCFQPAQVLIRIDFVDAAQEREGISGRQLVPEL